MLRDDHGSIGAGGSGARLITASNDAKWVMKAPIFGGQSHRFLCLNEAVCGLIGRLIGANVPDVAVIELTTEQLESFKPAARETERFAVATGLIEPAEALTPDTASQVPVSEVAPVIVLDAWVNNTDRKEEHVLVHQDESEDWHVTAIDHGHTIAMGDTLVDALLPETPQQPFPTLASRVTDQDLEPWIRRAQSVPREDLVAIVEALPSSWVVEPDASAVLADALVVRAKNLKRVLAPVFFAADNL